MKDFYPVTCEDFDKLTELVLYGVSKPGITEDFEFIFNFLLPLAVDLLTNIKKVRKFKKKIHEGSNEDILSEGLRDILKTWLDKNNGVGNLLEILTSLRSNSKRHVDVANYLESELLDLYTLPMSPEEGGICRYSSSRDFLQERPPVRFLNSREKALQNSVILEEIFKKLGIWEQKSFLGVAHTWLNETLSFWRRNTARIVIHVEMNCIHQIGIPISEYVKKFELEMKRNKSEEKASSQPRKRKAWSHNLTKHPFHSYQISYKDSRKPFLCGKIENKFWQLFSPYIADLKITHVKFSERGDGEIGVVCTKLFDACPNLKKLEFSTCSLRYAESSDEDKPRLKANKKKEKKNSKAGNLHTLVFGMDLPEKTLENILSICPNLKVLSLTNEDGLNDLSAQTGKLIKLEKLIFRSSYFTQNGFTAINNYVDLLQRNNFNSLQHLHLEMIKLPEARRAPFSLYAALGKCGETLKTMRLGFHLPIMHEFRTEWPNEEEKWLMDLSPFSFGSLTGLQIAITCGNKNYGEEAGPLQVKFDFGTLKGMPKLEWLNVSVEACKVLRNPGAKDWIFQGNRHKYFPSGLATNYFYSEEDPILCKNLRKFIFKGWALTKEDIRLVSGWFPNLTYLRCEVNPEHLLYLGENWKKLECVHFETEGFLSLRELRPLKQKKLRIRQTMNTGRNTRRQIELKERDKVLYFEDFK